MPRSTSLAVAALILGLGGCSQGVNPAQSVNPSQGTPASHFVAAVAQRPDAKQSNLLYVASTKTISMYSYADGQIGSLVDSFSVAAAAGTLCIDKEQRVYVPYRESTKGYIARYEHAATKPDLKYHFRQGAPIGCSHDNEHSRLATLDHGYHFYTWNVIVMPGRIKYAAPGPIVRSIVYDNAGALFLSGASYGSYSSQLVEVPYGDDSPFPVSVKGGTITSAGPLAWGNPNLLLVDEQYNGRNTPGVYQLAVSGTNAKIVGGFALTSSSHVASIQKVADKLIVADDASNAIEVYNFPSGSLSASFTPSGGVTSAILSQAR